MTISLDNLIGTRAWREPVAVRFYLGNRTVAQVNAFSPIQCDAFVVTDAGTVNPGSLAVSAGDLIEYDGTDWKKIVAGVGGFPPFGTRAVVAYGVVTLFSPLVDTQDEGKIAQWYGSSLTPQLEISLDGWTLLIKGMPGGVTEACDENSTWAFQGVVPTGSWVQTSGNLPVGSNIQDVGTANSAGTGGSVSLDNHVHRSPKPTTSNKDQAPLATLGDEEPTGITLALTPALDGMPQAFVNGVRYNIGDGVKTKACYFSADGGTTARSIAALVAGDQLIWNGSIAGFDLGVTDSVSLDYLAF